MEFRELQDLSSISNIAKLQSFVVGCCFIYFHSCLIDYHHHYALFTLLRLCSFVVYSGCVNPKIIVGCRYLSMHNIRPYQ